MAPPVKERARAKINLALHVTGKRADGYHLLDSLVAFADIGDELELAFGHEGGLTITGPFAHKLKAGDEENLILRAIEGLRGMLGPFPPVAVKLTKNLPVASGIGGGSADAAAAIRGVLALLGRTLPPRELKEFALGLGADVPVCLAGQSCRMRGIGEEITPQPLGPYAAVLANPGMACDTREVFRRLDLKQAFPPLADGLDIAAARNDLEAPAIAAVPVIADVLHALGQQQGAGLVRMSGSGATCFGLFADHALARKAAAALERAQPGWWVRAVTIS